LKTQSQKKLHVTQLQEKPLRCFSHVERMDRPCTSRMALKSNIKGEITHNKMIQQRTGRHQEKWKKILKIVSGS
jgi:hypothetical protein